MEYQSFKYNKNQDYGRFQPIIDTALELEDEIEEIIPFSSEENSENEVFSGVYILYKNGFRAEILSNKISNNKNQELYEITIYDDDNNVTFSTDITDSYEIDLELEEAIEIIKKVKKLDLDGHFKDELSEDLDLDSEFDMEYELEESDINI